MAAVKNAFMTSVYCWGDSLTEGVGGDVVGRTYSAVNLGCRGETIQTIMARQGSDPMVVGGFTIPASSAENVVVGYLKGSYFDSDRAGLATASGDLAQPLRESEAGINPCSIAGVKGRLYRDFTADASGRYAYRFKRETDGLALAVPNGTQIETYAMAHYRHGACVLWMGANGAVASHTAYIEKIKRFIAYGNYAAYVVVMAREYAEQWIGDIRTALTDADGTCHLLYLPPLLLARGYTLAGVAGSAGVPSTANWGTAYGVTDALLLGAPLLCAVNTSVPCGFESLHFSPYGYKAIGKLVTEKLGEMVGISSVNGTTDTGEDKGFETDVTDSFGALAFRLTRPKSGIGTLFDTGYTPYDTDKDWTICCKFADNINVVGGSLGSIFESYLYFPEAQKVTAVYLRKLIGADGVVDFSFAGGMGGFNMPRDQYGASTDGYRYAIITKQGNNFDFYFDGARAYNCALGYGIEERYSTRTLQLFGRVLDDGTNVGDVVTGEIAEFRVYEQYFTPEACAQILADMQG